jgi:hypothetical protein
LTLESPFVWPKNIYAWFTVGEVPGGTDAYFRNDAREIIKYWEGELTNPNCKEAELLIRECATTGHAWWFRRSINQPAIINLTYGLIAGSLAAITDGIVYSMDNAWDWQRMPATAGDFLTWYFRPDLTIDSNKREWAERCIGYLAEELDQAKSDV